MTLTGRGAATHAVPFRSSRESHRQLRPPVAVIALIFACTACSGGDASFTSDEVAETFAAHGIRLTEIIGEQSDSPLLSVLGPYLVPDRCSSEDLRVNVFRGSADVDAQLARSGFKPGKSRYVAKSEDGRSVVGLVRNNVIVAVVLKSECFSEVRAKKPLDALGS